MGLATEEDAYMATKQAIYSIIFDRDVTAQYRGKDDRGKKMVNAMVEMVNIGRYGTQTPQQSNLAVSAVGNLVESGDYYYQEFKVTSAVNISEYTILSTSNMPTNSFIANMSGNKTNKFSGTEHFKLMIPKSSLNVDISDVAIRVQGKCKTYPVFFGATPVSSWQDYAVTFDPYGDDNAMVRFSQKTNTAKIVINKTDDETSQPIANTTFQLCTAGGTVIANATTNSKGVAEFTGLYQNSYILKEISSNDKYILDTTEHTIELNYGETKTLDITNEHKKGTLEVVKVDKDNKNIALGGVVFDLFSKEFNKVIGTYTTDSNGRITIPSIRIGDFSLIEKSTNKWYNLAEDTDVSITWNNTTSQIVENELIKGQVKIVKIDKDNNEIRLAGIKFNVLDNKNRVLETVITDSNGEALTSRYAIRDFASLKIQECETLENYVLNDDIKTVELKAEQISTVTFENELKKGQVRVVKMDMDNNEVLLEGVEFEIYDEDNNLVDTIVTSSEGTATSKLLRIDKKYFVKESRTLSNYVLSNETKIVTLTQDKITDVKFENELKKGQVRVVKMDMDNNEVLLEGVEFEIYDEDNNLVDTIVTSSEGTATSKRLRIDKKYFVKESRSLSDYVLSDEVKTITLEQDKISEIQFENEKIKGYIQITKTSVEDNEYSKLPKGSPLADVTFEIYDSENNLVDTITTSETGTAKSKELVKGCYFIKEKTSAKYYLLNTKTYNAEIVKDQEVVNVDITNDNVNIDVEINKKGFIETQSKDNIYYTFKDIQNKSNVELDNFTWEDNLPTEALRIDKIYTGTWSQDLEYEVYYKTNLSDDYILFKDKLNTQKVYELDFNTLELRANEYVTSYQFRFGKVGIGFKEVESPILYCNMIDNLPNGFVFTNKTKVSGTYFEAYVEDNDDWTTITYKKQIKLNKVLPKTRLLKIN